jgi:hypothetical protein
MVRKIHRILMELDVSLIRIATLAPGKPLVSDDVWKSVERASEVAGELYRELFRPFLYHKVLDYLFFSVVYLKEFVSLLRGVCDKAWSRGVAMHPDPCDTHTLDSYVERIKRDFMKLAEHAGLQDEMRFVDSFSRTFLTYLYFLYSICKQTTGLNCLKHVGPEGAIPASLRIHVLDLASATRLIDDSFTRLYGDISEYRVGHVRLYEHIATPKELLSLAEYIANILHKQVEIEMAPQRLKGKILVLSLKDMVETAIHDIGDIIVKPRWVIDVHPLVAEKEAVVLMHILEERGFRVERSLTVTGEVFRVVMPPGDVREAVKIACMLPAIPSVAEVGEREAYWITLSSIDLLESKLREQKPIKKRKSSL